MQAFTPNKLFVNQLAKRNGRRIGIVGTVKRYGARFYLDEWRNMVLLVDVVDQDGIPLAEEIWMNAAQTVCGLGAVTGDRISFQAIVADYMDESYSLCYRLSYPIKLSIDSSNPNLFPEETARTPGLSATLELKELPFDRKSAIERIRAAAADGMICLEPGLRKPNGFWGVEDFRLMEMLSWLD
jgi:hypothetical protein